MALREDVVDFLSANKGRVFTKREIALALAHWKVDSLFDSECADWVKDPARIINQEYRAISTQLDKMRLRDLRNVRRTRIYN